MPEMLFVQNTTTPSILLTGLDDRSADQKFKGSESLISYTPSTSDHHHTLLFYGLKWCAKPSAPTSHEHTKIDNLCMAT